MSLFPLRTKHRDPLDEVLFSWPSRDPYRVKDLLRSVSIMGASGSGKSSGGGFHFAKVAAGYRNSGGLILASKPEDRDFWRQIFARAGRSHDLLIFGPHERLRFNFLDFLAGDARNITHGILTIAESLQGGESKGGGDDGMFWRQQTERTLYNAVEISRQAYDRVTAPDLQRFIHTAANHPGKLDETAWKEDFHARTFAQAHRREKSPIEAYDLQLAQDFWLCEWPQMADKLRASILASVMGIMHVFNSGIVRELASTTTNVSPAIMDQRKWVLVDMPIREHGESGRFLLGGWKYLTQRHVLRRRAQPGDAVTIIWADEAQTSVNTFDPMYLAECRSHLGCMVYLTQGLNSYYGAMPGQAGRHAADALLTNFHTKLFHAVGDDATAKFAASLVGMRLETHIGGSLAPSDCLYDEIMGHSKFTGSFSEQYEQVLQNSAFMNGLRTGGKANRYIVDGIVIRSGEPFRNGENWQWVEFRQR